MDEQLKAIIVAHGVFLRREAEQLGYHHTHIARLVRGGAWHRVRHGAYTFGDLWREFDDETRYAIRCRAAFRQAKTGVTLSHISALPFLEAPTWGLDTTLVHLTRADQRAGRKEAGVQQHTGLLVEGDVVTQGELSWTSATRAALEVTTMASVEAALCVVDDLLHRGLTTVGQLKQRYDSITRWPYTLRTQLVLRLASPLAESVAESRARYQFHVQGLPRPECQYEIRDAMGNFVARVDFAWPEFKLFVEFDGAIKYGRLLKPGQTASDAVVEEKKREDRIREVTGWRCIRLTWADLANPERTAQRIRQAMARAAA